MRLIPFTPDHFTRLASWFPDQRAVVVWAGPALRHPLDDAQFGAMLASMRTDPPERLCWMAERDGALVGHVQLAFVWEHGVARLGRVAIAPEARGRGLARPMVALAMAEAFARPEVVRLELNALPGNAPAVRTYESLGFRREGIQRSARRVGDERWDIMSMAVLRDEWLPLELNAAGPVLP